MSIEANTDNGSRIHPPVDDFRQKSFWLDSREYTESPSLQGDEQVDVAIVGGGYTGLSTAYFLKKQEPGLKVALLEARDYAVGTSSRSTKLIHGGLRYLAMGDVGLVRKTALERKEIFRPAPHL